MANTGIPGYMQRCIQQFAKEDTRRESGDGSTNVGPRWGLGVKPLECGENMDVDSTETQ